MEAKFEELCSKLFYNGLIAALVTDRDGVVLLKSLSSEATESMIDPIIPTTFSIANNQASKLGLGHNKSVVSVYELYQVIQLDHSPLIVTLIADSNANTGRFMVLGKDIIQLTQPLTEAINERPS